MADEQAHHGPGMGLAAELLVREVLVTGLHELANDEVRFRELVQREDALNQGSQGTWADDLLAAYRTLLDAEQPDYLNFKLGYPLDAGELPCVSIIKEAGAEDTGTAVTGDVLDVKSRQVGTYTYVPQSGVGEIEVPRLEAVLRLGTGWSTTVQVGSWTTSAELSLLLDAAVHNVLFRDKRRLFAAGVRDVSFSEGGTPTDATVQVELRVGYVPMQRLTLEWDRAQTRRSSAPNRVRIYPLDPLS